MPGDTQLEQGDQKTDSECSGAKYHPNPERECPLLH